MLKKMLSEDFKYWKVNRFVKDQEDVKNIEQIVVNHIVQLKDIYITLICTSIYPNINWLEFTNFVKQCGILDHVTQISTIDRLFIATNVELEEIEENPDRALCRYEFFEILVRIAA